MQIYETEVMLIAINEGIFSSFMASEDFKFMLFYYYSNSLNWMVLLGPFQPKIFYDSTKHIITLRKLGG